MKKSLVIAAVVVLAVCGSLLGAIFFLQPPRASSPQPSSDTVGREGKVAELVLALNHPDVARQRQAMDELRQMGKDVAPVLRKQLAVGNDELKNKIQRLLAELEGRVAPLEVAPPAVAPPPVPAPGRLPSHPVRKRDWHREGWTLPDALVEQLNEGDPFNPSKPLPLVSYEWLVKWAKHNPSRWQDLMQYLDSVPFHRREEHIRDMRGWQVQLTDLMTTVGLKCAEEDDGLRVIEVRPDSIAARLGIAAGDQLVKANGIVIRNLGDAKRAFLEAIDRGDAFFEVDIIRNKQSITLILPNQ